MKNFFLASAALLGLSLSGLAQQRVAVPIFQEDAAARAAAQASPLTAALRASRPFTLATATLRSALAAAPLEGRGGVPVTVALPLPAGGTGRFAVVESSVMEPGLAAQFPQLKTYAGYGLDDATASVRLDLTPAGFHAQVLSHTTGTFYIDPVTRTDTQHYLSFFRRDMNRAASGQTGLNCGFRPTAAEAAATAQRVAQAGSSGGGTANRSVGGTLRTYRLALASTKEYTNFFGTGGAPGTVAQGMAAMVVTVNRVVGVLEKEMDVRFVLVNNNNLLVSTNANPGPYSNTNPNALLTQNQTTVDSRIGSANYDIGHVLGTGGGGLAGLGVVCGTRKAQGETGDTSPVGDSFDIDYVVHEMGHQLGANHTFDGNGGSCGGGNRNASTAYEPGSGTTIMAYAGICGTNNDTQQHSDPYFHTVSFDEIQTYLNSTSCAVTGATGNTPPAVTGPTNGKTLPANTPFKLTAVGTDADGDALTYCWEEFDLAGGNGGAYNAPQVANRATPLFRSFNPTASPTRYFPQLGPAVVGERLPTVTRTMKFRCTVRDEHVGNLGVIGGVNYSPDVTMNVTSTAGPFVVTAPNTALTYAGGSAQTVTWNLANTNLAPVNCQLVDVLLSTDGGLTYPLTLATAVPNSGSAAVTIPTINTTTARVMVAAADNYFYDISDVDFTISGPVVPFITSLSPNNGVVGATVTITGTGFSGANSVSFNGTAATFTVLSNTSISVTVPVGATTGAVTVSAPSGTSNGVTFTVTIPTPPVITSISPTSGPVGTTVTISGTGFSGSTAVSFNGTAATYTVVNSTTITATVPLGAATGTLTVTNPLGTSNGVIFTVTIPAPVITTLNPVSGFVGNSVTITGTGFGGTTAVSFNGTAATFTVVSGTSITVTVPVGATTGNVTVTAAGGVSNGVPFTVNVPLPVLTSINPTRGFTGIAITLTGINFTGATTVYFNGVPTTAFTVVNNTTITTTVPAGTTTGGVTVTTPYGTSNLIVFTVVQPNPTLTSLSPTTALVGTTITLTGTNLSGATAVSFNGTPGTGFIVVNATTITVNVPAGATTGNVTVTTPVATTNGVLFTVQAPAPVITRLNPNSGFVGSTVFIQGTNLQGATAISFNGIPAVSTFNGSTSITVTVPVGATTGNVTVTTPGGTSNGVLFTVTVPAPTILSLAPATGPVGTVVIITGTYFTGATIVSFNGTPSVGYTVVNATTIRVNVPVGATTGNVVVTTPGGFSNGRPFTVTRTSATRSAAGLALAVYPNPTQAGQGWQLKLAAPAPVAHYTLCNVLGQVVRTGQFAGDAATIGSAGLAAGSYVLQVALPNAALATQRLVLE